MGGPLHFSRMLLLLLLLVTAAGLCTSTPQISFRKSTYTHDEALSRILSEIATGDRIQGAFRTVSVYDHKARAEAVNMNLRPTTTIVIAIESVFTYTADREAPLFFNNTQESALDSPWKVLVWEDDTGSVFVGYNDPRYISSRHGMGVSFDKSYNDVSIGLDILLDVGSGNDEESTVISSTITSAGIVRKISSRSVNETAQKLQNAIENSGGTVESVVDIAATQSSTETDIQPLIRLVYGNVEWGTNMMLENQLVAMDFPFTAVVWTTGPTEHVFISYNSLDIEIKQRHGLMGADALTAVRTAEMWQMNATDQAILYPTLNVKQSSHSLEESIRRGKEWMLLPGGTEVDVPGVFNVGGDLLVKVYGRIDFHELASASGMELRNTTTIIWGGSGQPHMIRESQRSGLDFPIQAVFWEDGNGDVFVGTNADLYMPKRYAAPDTEVSIKEFSTFLPNVYRIFLLYVTESEYPQFAVERSISSDGLLRKQSPYDVGETMDRLVANIEAAGLQVFRRLNHATEALTFNSWSNELRPAELVVFTGLHGEYSRYVTTVLQENQLAGLTGTSLMHAYQDRFGQVWLEYNDYSMQMTQRQGLVQDDSLAAIAEMQNVSDSLVVSSVASKSIIAKQSSLSSAVAANSVAAWIESTQALQTDEYGPIDLSPLKVYLSFNYGDIAEDLGREMPGNVCVLWFGGQEQIALMVENQEIGLDLPLQIIFWDDDDGNSFVGYNDPEYYITRYSLNADAKKVIGQITAIYEAATETVSNSAQFSIPGYFPIKGLIRKKSNYTVSETIDNLRAAFTEDSGIEVNYRLDFGAEAKAFGPTYDLNAELRAAELLIFGNTDSLISLLQENQQTAMDLPMAALAYSDENGQTWLIYNDVNIVLTERHYLTTPSSLNVVTQMAMSLEMATDSAIAVGTVIAKPSIFSVPDTVQNIIEYIQDGSAGLNAKVYAVVDHQEDAAAYGVRLRPTTTIIWGGEDQSFVISGNIEAGLDQPLKILVWEDADGVVFIGATTMEYIYTRHDENEYVQNSAYNGIASNISDTIMSILDIGEGVDPAFFVSAPVNADGLIRKRSPYTPKETLDRLEALLVNTAVRTVLRVDHRNESLKYSDNYQELTAPIEVIMVGNPSKDAVLMQENQLSALDLPTVALAYSDADGQSWLLYNDVNVVFRTRHQLIEADSNIRIDNMARDLDDLTNSAVAVPTMTVREVAGRDVAGTIVSIRSYLDDQGCTVYGTVDYQDLGATITPVSLTLFPINVINFGCGEELVLLEENRQFGLDLPLKMLAWETEVGDVLVAYNNPSYLRNRYAFESSDRINDAFDRMGALLDSILEVAANGASTDAFTLNAVLPPSPGFLTRISPYSVKETVDRLEKVNNEEETSQNNTLRVNFSAEAAGLGISIPATEVLYFGAVVNDALIIKEGNYDVGIDLPHPVLVYRNTDSQTVVLWNNLSVSLIARHRLVDVFPEPTLSDRVLDATDNNLVAINRALETPEMGDSDVVENEATSTETGDSSNNHLDDELDKFYVAIGTLVAILIIGGAVYTIFLDPKDNKNGEKQGLLSSKSFRQSTAVSRV